jgi:hypothetical protein
MFYRTNFLGNVKPFSEKIFDRMIPRLSQGKNGGEIFFPAVMKKPTLS